MGLKNAIEMRGPHSYDSVRFTLSHTLVPRQALLRLIYSFDPGLDEHGASLEVGLNGMKLGTLAPSVAVGLGKASTEFDIPVPPDQLVRNNNITFEFTGGSAMQQEDQAKAKILAHISEASSVEVVGDRLSWRNDLSQLPMPLFDPDLQSATTVTFLFLTPPGPGTLQAAGIVASWLGLQAGSRPVIFATLIGEIPKGDVIVLTDNSALLPSLLRVASITGPELALRANPSDPLGSVLLLAGDNDGELLTVARTLALTSKATTAAAAQGIPLGGNSMLIPELALPAARIEGDAPRWLTTGRAVPFASCKVPEALQTDGSSPIPVYFHVPPDLFYGEKQNIKLHLHFRYDALQIAVGSALRVVVNGNLVNEAQLLPGKGMTDRDRQIFVPVADIRPFGNTILFNFDFVPAKREATALRGEILCNSSMDMQGLASWTPMPNLKLFANAGFPFTQFADLSETTVVLPANPSIREISLYLQLMGHFAAQTGYPALRVTVAGPSAVIRKDRDYLVLGSLADQPAFDSLGTLLHVRLEMQGLKIKQQVSFQSVVSSVGGAMSYGWATITGGTETQKFPSALDAEPDALIEEIESPSSPGRSIVLITLKQDSSSSAFADAFVDRSQSDDMSGSVSLLRNAKFTPYAMDGATYHVGDISWYAMMRIWLTHYFIPLLLFVTALSFLVALWTREWLQQHAEERLKLAGLSDIGI